MIIIGDDLRLIIPLETTILRLIIVEQYSMRSITYFDVFGSFCLFNYFSFIKESSPHYNEVEKFGITSGHPFASLNDARPKMLLI